MDRHTDGTSSSNTHKGLRNTLRFDEALPKGPAEDSSQARLDRNILIFVTPRDEKQKRHYADNDPDRKGKGRPRAIRMGEKEREYGCCQRETYGFANHSPRLLFEQSSKYD